MGAGVSERARRERESEVDRCLPSEVFDLELISHSQLCFDHCVVHRCVLEGKIRVVIFSEHYHATIITKVRFRFVEQEGETKIIKPIVLYQAENRKQKGGKQTPLHKHTHTHS